MFNFVISGKSLRLMRPSLFYFPLSLVRRIHSIAFPLALFCAFLSSAHAKEPEFRLEKFFAGHTRSSGVFYNTIGPREERFTTDCHGRLRGGVLFLDQLFRYADGHTQRRRWEIRRVGGHRYVGRANDVVGEARGAVSGARFRFRYVVALKKNNPFFDVHLEQTMTLRRDGVLDNRATIRKLGLLLSRVREEFRRVD